MGISQNRGTPFMKRIPFKRPPFSETTMFIIPQVYDSREPLHVLEAPDPGRAFTSWHGSGSQLPLGFGDVEGLRWDGATASSST